MADYKKKITKRGKKTAKNLIEDNIRMQPAYKKSHKEKSSKQSADLKNNETENKQIKIIKGKSKTRARNRHIIELIIILIICTVIIISVALPTGIVDFIGNSIAVAGTGGFPQQLSGSIINTVKTDSGKFYVLSATEIYLFNNNGKLISEYQHGYEMPLISTSSTRYLLADIGGHGYSVYNFSKMLKNGESEYDILTADIADNGYYAIATQSDSYASEVCVYNSKNSRVFKWFCSEYIINGVALSPNGKTLAVSAVGANGGKFISKIYILKYNSATPSQVYTVEDDYILSLKKVSNRGFCTVCENKISYYSWKHFENKPIISEKSISAICYDSSFFVTVSHTTGNKNQNQINVYNKKFDSVCQFDFNFQVIDARIINNHIFLLSEKSVHIYNTKGEKKGDYPCKFGVEHIVPVSNTDVVGLSDTVIEKITKKQEE